MPFINEKYSEQKIDNLYNFLQSSKEQGEAEDYEIFVDAFKVVKRTNDLARFETYSNFIQPETKAVTIVIYDGTSPRNTKHIFTIKEDNTNGLSGVDVDTRIEEKLRSEKEKWETDLLKKENEKLKTELSEAEAYIEELEVNAEKAKDKKFRMGDVNVGEFASVMLEGFVRRNPQLLTKLPGGEALAGVIEQDNADREKALLDKSPEPEVSFKKSGSATDNLSEEEKSYLDFIKSLKDKFDHEQMTSVMLILDVLAKSPNDIDPTIQYLSDLHKK
ncbi:MAG: hypothetical protein Q7W13_09580 [Bacteroidia bacterium]|nr:hypothetical protein [Bacteroidia bacterium]